MHHPAYNLIKNARIGSIVPFIEELPYALNPVEYFAKLSDNGRKKNSLLLESANIVPKYGERSIGSAEPCLKVTGKGENFEITALTDSGIRFLESLKNDFDFCDEVIYSKDKISGILKAKKEFLDEGQRLKSINHTEILRRIAFKFKPVFKPFMPYAGLFGFISYDFIDQFEDLPQNEKDLTEDPDYLMYFLDTLFLIDHKANKTFFVANALITDSDEKIYDECIGRIENYKSIIDSRFSGQKNNEESSNKKSASKISSDTSKEEFIELVNKIKDHIIAGDVYQAVLSRTIIAEFEKKPFDVYNKLRQLNPSPYMFYINTGDNILLGASPEMSLRVQGGTEKTIEMRPIAGTKSRGIINGKIDFDLDSRFETELKTDPKEISEHIMLVDLARNDVARISKPGSRYIDEVLVVEKYSHVQHLVTNVRGVLKNDLDALHAYLATMNMGTLTGAPKVEAMKLLRIYEKTKRGFYGGAVGYITPSGDLDSAILIRSINIKGNKGYVRTGAGIVYDSNPENEFLETEKKAKACLNAIELAGG